MTKRSTKNQISFSTTVSAGSARNETVFCRAGFVDIGSNSIRTMIAERRNDVPAFFDKTVHTTRLAEGLMQTGQLSDNRMKQALAVIRAFTEQMHKEQVPVYAYATNAVRDASNQAAFVSAIRNLSPAIASIEVLSGEQEARYAYLAATGGSGGMLDIGGGSAQLTNETSAFSFPMGCVRARDLCPNGTLEEISQVLRPRLDELTAECAAFSAPLWTGVGGTITTLAAVCAGMQTYERDAINGMMLDLDMLTRALSRLEALGSARADIPILAHRHDVILHGGAILMYLIHRFSIPSLRVSDADGLEGYALHIMNRA